MTTNTEKDINNYFKEIWKDSDIVIDEEYIKSQGFNIEYEIASITLWSSSKWIYGNTLYLINEYFEKMGMSIYSIGYSDNRFEIVLWKYKRNKNEK